MLDSTHVIGGPITARTLAEFGADVLHLSRIDFDHMNWRMETDIGKRAAYCDFRDPADHARFAQLLQEADVFTCSFLNLDQKGVSPKTLATMKPGIIAPRACAATTSRANGPTSAGSTCWPSRSRGMSTSRAPSTPSMMPVQAIFADYLAGYVGAAAVASALLKRADDGGATRSACR